MFNLSEWRDLSGKSVAELRNFYATVTGWKSAGVNVGQVYERKAQAVAVEIMKRGEALREAN